MANEDKEYEALTKHEKLIQYIGKLKIGTKLSVRSMAEEFDVSEGTAYKAIKEAETLGLVSTKERIGTVRIERKKRGKLDRLTFAEVTDIVEGRLYGGATGLNKTLHKFVIGAMELDAMVRYIDAGSLLIVGNRDGFGHLDPIRDVRITLLEGAPRILAPLPERVSSAALKLLNERGIQVVTDCRVTAIAEDHVSVGEQNYPSDIVVWAAGIKAPAFLASLGLPTAKGGQIEVTGELQVKGVPDVYALGDCAQCMGADGKPVPPRAQAAHQQADYLLETFMRQVKGKPLQGKPYEYRDYGSLVSFGQSTSVGSLMGSLRGFNWFVEGFFARMMYVSLHLLHHQAVLGTVRTGVLAVARFLVKRATPLVKLH